MLSEDNIIYTCPHCNNMFMVNKKEMNCKIIRHAYYKKTMTQVDPHLSKEICDKLVENDLVYGCCKPVKIYENGTVEIVGYI